MALTMTRTRTQTALTKMATLLANLNGELEFVRALQETEPTHRDALKIREAVLQQKREAVMVAIRQFDPDIGPEMVGKAEGWRAPYGCRTHSAFVSKYLARPEAEAARAAHRDFT